jgi:hypothetical protein
MGNDPNHRKVLKVSKLFGEIYLKRSHKKVHILLWPALERNSNKLVIEEFSNYLKP